MSRVLRLFAFCSLLIFGSNCLAITQGRIVGVLDGDTVDLLTESKELIRIRLSGIDAPEKKQPFGNLAKQTLSDLAYNRAVLVDATKHDRYGRLVGKVLVNGGDVNLEMVRRGLAWHYKKYKREQSSDDRVQYEKAEDAARLQRLGLWRDPHPIAPWDFRRQSRGNAVTAQRQSAN